jgi:hypothetical protein
MPGSEGDSVEQRPSQGILYIAAGAKYIRAAMRSAESVRRHCDGLSTHLFADWRNHREFDFDRDPSPFVSTAMINDGHRRSKVDYLARTPFDHTLYLDTDTLINADIREMFRVLERFDLAVNHAHRRNDRTRLGKWRMDLPHAFPQLNGGVLLYRRTPPVIEFLEQWKHDFHEAGLQQDQMTLRESLWLSDLRLAILPPEYNVRYIKYHFIWSRAEARTKIFHLQRLHSGWFWWVAKPWQRRAIKVLRRLGFHPPEAWYRR